MILKTNFFLVTLDNISLKMSRRSVRETAKVPKLALLYFAEENSTMILGTRNVTFLNDEKTEETVVWKGNTLPYKDLKMTVMFYCLYFKIN